MISRVRVRIRTTDPLATRAVSVRDGCPRQSAQLGQPFQKSTTRTTPARRSRSIRRVSARRWRSPRSIATSWSASGRTRRTRAPLSPCSPSRSPSPLRDRRVAEPDLDTGPSARAAVGERRVEALDRRREHLQRVTFGPHFTLDQERIARLEAPAGAAEQLGEHGDLERAARVRQLDEGEAGARGRPLLLAEHHAGEFDPLAAACRQLIRKHDAELCQAGAVAIQRMRRQIETERVELLLQPLEHRKILDRRQRRLGQLSVPAQAAEQAGLVAGRLRRVRVAVTQRELHAVQQRGAGCRASRPARLPGSGPPAAVG